jgi:glycopeptide antibiotics resistance protein
MLNSIPIKKFIPAILWFLLVLFLICLPGQEFPEMDGWSAWLEKIHFDKWVHAGMFGIMMILFSLPFKTSDLPETKKKSNYLIIAVLICIWGLATECIQLYVPFRSFDLLDWAADSLGAVIALYVMRLFPTK